MKEDGSFFWGGAGNVFNKVGMVSFGDFFGLYEILQRRHFLLARKIGPTSFILHLFDAIVTNLKELTLKPQYH